MALHPRVASITLPSNGSNQGTIGVPASRLAGVYYQLSPDSGPTIDVSNLGRSVFRKNGAHNQDGVQEFLEPVEPLVFGDCVIAVSGGQQNDIESITLFLDYGRL